MTRPLHAINGEVKSEMMTSTNGNSHPDLIAKADQADLRKYAETVVHKSSIISPRESPTEARVGDPDTNENPTASKDTADSSRVDAADESGSIYGTRSRNRTSRPNYAHDQDDMEFEYAISSHSKVESSKKANGIMQPSNEGSETQSKVVSLNSKKRKAPGGNISTSNESQMVKSDNHGANTTRTTSPHIETNVMTFFTSGARLNGNGGLAADDGTEINIDDHVYLVCEPPGEPYYLCRIMEFIHTISGDLTSPVDAIRVNWFYRPRDVQRASTDTRLIYGTMHSDLCPLASLRGKCSITHRCHISDLDEYRKKPNHFWYNQIFDRFIRRFYEVIPVEQVINVPDRVKTALDERWKYIAVEANRVKELTSAVKLCKRCTQYCATQDSVECAICGNAYHMNCMSPPLPKKPTRGFAWSCGPCSRLQEKKLEARLPPPMGANQVMEDEIMEEEEEEKVEENIETPDAGIEVRPVAQSEVAQAKMWPFRYLGIHCRVEDVLQYDDRAIYPRASSRFGPRYEVSVDVWHGRPLQLVKATEIKKQYIKTNSHKKDAKLSKETIAAIEAARVEKANRPPWIVDSPPGYVSRGEDYPNDDPRNTATLIYKTPEIDQVESLDKYDSMLDNFMHEAKLLAKPLRVSEYSSNLMDKALSLLVQHNYQHPEIALAQLAKLNRFKDLKEPVLTQVDLKKFEEGVSKHGSEHRLIRQYMKTDLPMWAIVRFYYIWKKTPQGRAVWNSFGGRKSTRKKLLNHDDGHKSTHQLADDGDDSAFDVEKASVRKQEFQCKFCDRRNSRQWRRAPGVVQIQEIPSGKDSKAKGAQPIMALCLRCAGLWRRYAIEWEEQDEVARKIAQGGGKYWKRRIDEELLRELQIENKVDTKTPPDTATATPEPGVEPAKKKVKTGDPLAIKSKTIQQEPPPPAPIVPAPPKWRKSPCAVCKVIEADGEKPLHCSHCRLAVHKRCYGVDESVDDERWICDQCSNDKAPLVSTDYNCILCPVEFTPQELWELPKISHRKKTDRDREKERLEKELLEKTKRDYIEQQNQAGRPVQPREALKKTDGNNWVHVLCAVWTPEIKFSDAKRYERAEGFSSIPLSKFETVCKLCKSSDHGACVACLQCHTTFHVTCAFEANYTFGFDVTPVKGSRKDQVTTVTLGPENGYLTPAIWCRDHTPKTIVHPMTELVDNTTALQLFVEKYKQADQSLSIAARKANLINTSIGNHLAGTVNVHRRGSLIGANSLSRKSKNTNSTTPISATVADGENLFQRTSSKESSPSKDVEKQCTCCGTVTTPKWWPIEDHSSIASTSTDGNYLHDVECHKCHYTHMKPARHDPFPLTAIDIKLDWPPSLSSPQQVIPRPLLHNQSPHSHHHASMSPTMFHGHGNSHKNGPPTSHRHHSPHNQHVNYGQPLSHPPHQQMPIKDHVFAPMNLSSGSPFNGNGHAYTNGYSQHDQHVSQRLNYDNRPLPVPFANGLVPQHIPLQQPPPPPPPPPPHIYHHVQHPPSYPPQQQSMPSAVVTTSPYLQSRSSIQPPSQHPPHCSPRSSTRQVYQNSPPPAVSLIQGQRQDMKVQQPISNSNSSYSSNASDGNNINANGMGNMAASNRPNIGNLLT